MKAEAAGLWLQAKGHLEPPGAGRDKEGASREPLEGAWPCSTLITDSGLRTGDESFRCFKPSSVW